MRIVIIIVNYCTADLTCACLQSLNGQLPPGQLRVIVVDNGSMDGSIDRLAQAINFNNWNDWVILLALNHNGGFAVGNNAAIQLCFNHEFPPDYLMLLNPDTVVHAGSVERLACFLTEHPDAGIVGAQLENGDHSLESSSRNYPSVWSELDNGARLGILTQLLNKHQVSLPVMDRAHRCEWVSGAAMMIRREVFEQIGLLDENFFLYFEELDFCRRAGNVGWQTWLEPAALITHFEGQATGIQHTRKRRGKYWYDSRRRYFVKHHGIVKWILCDLFWGLGRMSLLLRNLLRFGGNTNSDPSNFMRDLLVGDLFALLAGEAFDIKREKKDNNRCDQQA